MSKLISLAISLLLLAVVACGSEVSESRMAAPGLEGHMEGFTRLQLRDLSNDDLIPDYIRDERIAGYVRFDDFEIVIAGSVLVDEDWPHEWVSTPTPERWGLNREMEDPWEGFFNDMVSLWVQTFPPGEECTVLSYPRVIGNLSGTTACPIMVRRVDTHADSPFEKSETRRLTLEVTAFARDRHLGIIMVFYRPGRANGPHSVGYAHLLDRSIVDYIISDSVDRVASRERIGD